jgi:hypothetical protein
MQRLAFPVVAALALAALCGSIPRLAAQQNSQPGTIVTVAGTGTAGFSGDGGPATQAQLNHPQDVALDAQGNLFIAELDNYRVRKVSRDGIITTVAGTGEPGFSGDGGPAAQARLQPAYLVFDGAGNLFISDWSGDQPRIRKISREGIITTVAGGGKPADRRGDGGPAVQARLSGAIQLAVDAAGNLFIADRADNRVRRVSPDGIITTVAGGGKLAGGKGDGGPATAAQLGTPTGLAVDTAGNLFIVEQNSYRVRKVSPEGIITTVAGMGKAPYVGDGGPATATGLRGPGSLAVDAAGNLVIAESALFRSDGLGDNERVLKVFGVAAPGLLAGKPFPNP